MAETPDRRDQVGQGSDGTAKGRRQLNARVGLAAVLIGLGLWTIHDFLPALAWAAILSIAVWPLYEKAQRRWPPGKHNVLLPGLFTIAIAIVFGLPFVVLLIQGAREAHEVMDLYRQATTSGIPVPEFVQHLPFGSEAVSRWWQDNLAGGIQPGAISSHVNRSSVVTFSRELGRDLVHRTVLFFFALMTLFFLLKEGKDLIVDLLEASERAFGPKGERIARQMVASVHGTVDGLVLVGLGEGVLMGIAYAVAGVPHPTLFAGLTAVAAMVPFAVTVVFIGIGLLLVVQGSVVSAIVIVLLGTVMAFLADHLIRPALIGGTTRLPFLWVLFGILGGVETWGLVGLFVGPALMSALILLWREFVGHAGPASAESSPHA